MSAVAEIPLATPSAGPSWLQRMSALDRAQRMRLGVGIALLVAFAVAAIVFGRQPDYRVLFANLNDKDGGAIVAQLSQMNVPYKHADGGGAILIPADRVHDVRLRLATQGLPKGSVAGFELMEASKFGMTQFQERLNFQRGLEGELTRSIQALSSVQGARVHLALPNQNGFFREQQKPSASVLVSLHPGRILDRAQLAGIVHLVASSVPELAPSAVSVLDDTGKLLSQSPDAAGSNGIDAQQLLYVQQMEQQYTKRIMDILEPVVGRNNVKAQVSAEVDFTQTDLGHGVLELQAVFGLVDGLGCRADQFNVVLFQHAVVPQIQRAVQRGLATHGWQDRKTTGVERTFLGDDLLDRLPGDGLDVGDVRRGGVGHDGRRVAVDQDDLVTLFAQSLTGLYAGVVELTGLANDDRASADDED